MQRKKKKMKEDAEKNNKIEEKEDMKQQKEGHKKENGEKTEIENEEIDSKKKDAMKTKSLEDKEKERIMDGKGDGVRNSTAKKSEESAEKNNKNALEPLPKGHPKRNPRIIKIWVLRAPSFESHFS